jgi:cytoskeletal protein CcmA (bactofilin family)
VSESESFVGRGAFFEGKLAFGGTIRIDGHVRGDVRGDGTLVVGEGGTVEATIDVGSLVVLGAVVGEIVAKERVRVAPRGRVEGRVRSPKLVVEEGALVSAQIDMGGR